MKLILFFCMTGIVLNSCSSVYFSANKEISKDPKTILHRIWSWESTADATETIVNESPERYTLVLADQGRARIQFDCNRGGGQFYLSHGQLSFGPMFSTRMACPAGSLDRRFSHDLSRVVSFYTQADMLYFGLTDGGLMVFHEVRTAKGD